MEDDDKESIRRAGLEPLTDQQLSRALNEPRPEVLVKLQELYVNGTEALAHRVYETGEEPDSQLVAQLDNLKRFTDSMFMAWLRGEELPGVEIIEDLTF